MFASVLKTSEGAKKAWLSRQKGGKSATPSSASGGSSTRSPEAKDLADSIPGYVAGTHYPKEGLTTGIAQMTNGKAQALVNSLQKKGYSLDYQESNDDGAFQAELSKGGVKLEMENIGTNEFSVNIYQSKAAPASPAKAAVKPAGKPMKNPTDWGAVRRAKAAALAASNKG